MSSYVPLFLFVVRFLLSPVPLFTISFEMFFSESSRTATHALEYFYCTEILPVLQIFIKNHFLYRAQYCRLILCILRTYIWNTVCSSIIDLDVVGSQEKKIDRCCLLISLKRSRACFLLYAPHKLMMGRVSRKWTDGKANKKARS